jgi:hypothetical protein
LLIKVCIYEILCIIFVRSIRQTLKNTNYESFEKNTILKATSVCDSNCVWTAKVLERKGNFIIAVIQGKIVRKKVNIWNGEEVYLLGKYSMAQFLQ